MPIVRSNSFFDSRFVGEHYGDLVADGIDEGALGVYALDARLIVLDPDVGLALRTAKDL